MAIMITPLLLSLRRAATLSLACIGLLGCSGFSSATFPDASANPAQVPLGTIGGSVYGGHAPLVGAHVYVLTPNQTNYGLQASSLLSATYQANGGGTTYATHINTSDPNIPTTWYYETTDSTGAYNISGDYTCTAGNPIYLYAYGGTPTYPSANNAFSISNINVESRSGGNKTYTILFTVDPAVNPVENLYAGEQITLSGFTGNYAFLNSTVGYVAGNSLLSTTSFELSASVANAEAATPTLQTYTTTGATLAAGSQSVGTDGIATALPGLNPAVVNLALLGVCPSTGSLSAGGTLFNGTTSSPIQYVYMNEVSTAAAAYALEGFTPTAPTSTTNATYVGTSANNLIGLQNAFLNAAQLYDINGSKITTSYAGEGHIANPKTPAGNGSVPQNLLDTMGNILAACVDSNNTSTIDGNTGESAQCKTLFETATSNGVPKGGTGTVGTIPVDTAQAMLNIAHHPAGDPSNTTTFMTNLYTLPTGNVPFAPNLATAGAGQPNDFTVAIQYPQTFTTNSKITSATSLTTNAFGAGPESVAIDSYGNVWINTLNNHNSPWNIMEISPLGVLNYTSPTSTFQLGYVSIDPNNNVYSGSNYVQGDETEVLASGTANLATTRTVYTYTGNYGGTTAPYNADGFYNGYMSVALPNGNVFIGSAPPGQTTDAATEYTLGLTGSMNLTGLPSTSSSLALTSLFTPVSMGTAPGSVGTHGAVENASASTAAPNSLGYVWWTNEVYSGSGLNVLAINRVNASGTPVTGFPITYAANNAVDRPEMPAIDQSGNLWAAARLSNTLLEVTPSGTVTTYTGPALNGPFGVAFDGDNNLFISANVGSGNSIAEFNATTKTTLSPATNNYTLGGQLADPLNLSTDQSGNLWITTNTNNTIVEWIGAGAPLYTPLSKASKNNAVSTRP